MKAEIIRDDIEPSPAFIDRLAPELMERRETWRDGRMQSVLFFKRGAVIEEKFAFRMVQQGFAVPADDECRLRARRTPQQMKEAQHAYERLHRGIHPEDFDLYEAGYIIGYNPDGSFKPGPKWDEYVKLMEESGVDDEEDDNG